MDQFSIKGIEEKLSKDSNELTESDVLYLLAREVYLDTDELDAVKNSPAGKALAKKENVEEEVKEVKEVKAKKK